MRPLGLEYPKRVAGLAVGPLRRGEAVDPTQILAVSFLSVF
jgi:hypothetical protein